MNHRSIHLVSWNIRGLKTRNKLCKVLQNLTEIEASIAFLQETHIGPGDEKILEDLSGWKSYFTVYNSNGRGVAILVKNDLQFKYLCHDEDYDGGYIVLFCQIGNYVYTLVNVYKHSSVPHMLMRLAQYLQETVSGILVIGGDFNGVLDPVCDRQRAFKSSKSDGHLLQFMRSLNICDIWCVKNPADTVFTFKEKSRIDMFFLPKKNMESVKSIAVRNINISDHQPLALELFLPQHVNITQQLQSRIKILSAMSICTMREISGGEILTAMKSFGVTENGHLFEISRTNYLIATETVKRWYSQLFLNNNFTDFRCSPDGPPTPEHLLVTKVIDNYVKVQISSVEAKLQKERKHTNERWNLILKPTKQKIYIPFLRTILNIPCSRNIYIIRKLLADGPSRDHKLLLDNCFLTDSVLTLALKHLADEIIDRGNCSVILSQMRLTLFVYGDVSRKEIKEVISYFRNVSGLEVSLMKVLQSTQETVDAPTTHSS